MRGFSEEESKESHWKIGLSTEEANWKKAESLFSAMKK